MDLVLSQPTDLAAFDNPLDAAVVPVPRQQNFFFGINQQGQLYAYGEAYGAPLRVLDPSSGLAFAAIFDCQVSERSDREYLDLRMQAPVPNYTFVLALPCQGSLKADGTTSTQWSVRSLLGALCNPGLDLRARPGIVTARRGTGGTSGLAANFIDVFLATDDSPDASLKQVYAEAIGGDRNDLEIAVNQVRRALDLEPQFP